VEMRARFGLLFSSLLLSVGCLPVTHQLAAPMHMPAGGPPTAVTAVDLNGDGKLDLVVTRVDVQTTGGGEVSESTTIRSTHGSLAVMLGHGDGTFTEAFNTVGTGIDPTYVAAVDLNGDGRLDLVTTGLLANGFISVLFGHGDGTFNQPMSITVGPTAGGVKVGDLNGDGKPDLVVLDKRPDPRFQGGKLVSLLGHGDGTFDAGRSVAVEGTLEAFALGDFSGDGRLDAMVADSRRVGLSFYVGQGDGSFASAGFMSTNFAPVGVVAVDINKDGKLDLSVGSVQGTGIYLGLGNGSFRHVEDYYLEYTKTGWFADFDNDGKLDFVSARRLFRGDGTGHFTPMAMPQDEYDDSFVTAADLNNDGFADVIAADQAHSRLDIYLNRGGTLPTLRASR
jgi:FG-GAP-like repeat